MKRVFVTYEEGRYVRKIRYGEHKGLHMIYKTLSTFRRDFPDEPLIPWKQAKKGDWILGDDGVIVQCLKVSELINKSKQHTKCFKTCFGTFALYVRKDGTSSSRLAYRERTPNDISPSSMAVVAGRRGKYMVGKKKEFIRLVFQKGMEPTAAYMVAYPTCTSPRYAKQQVKKILLYDHEQVAKVLRMGFREEFEKLGVDKSFIAKKYVEIIDTTRSSMAKIEALRDVLILRGDIKGKGEAPNYPNQVNSSMPQPIGLEDGDGISVPKLIASQDAEFEEVKDTLTSNFESSMANLELYKTAGAKVVVPVFDPDSIKDSPPLPPPSSASSGSDSL